MDPPGGLYWLPSGIERQPVNLGNDFRGEAVVGLVGVSIAAFKHGRVLLTKRDDFRVWCLPGGHLEAGESVVEGARREFVEETGLEAHITRLVGLYSRPQWDDGGYLIAVFAGTVSGGVASPQQGEVVEMAYFGPEELPSDLLVGQRQRILDAFSGAGGSLVRSEHVAWPFDRAMSRAALYQMRDESGLPPEAFYAQHFGFLEAEGSTLEVGPAE